MDYSDRKVRGVGIKDMSLRGDCVSAKIQIVLSALDDPKEDGPTISIRLAIPTNQDSKIQDLQTSLLESAIGVLNRATAETADSLLASKTAREEAMSAPIEVDYSALDQFKPR